MSIGETFDFAVEVHDTGDLTLEIRRRGGPLVTRQEVKVVEPATEEILQPH